MVIQGFLKRIREQKRRLNKKLLLLTIQQQNEEILSLKASVRNLKLINKKQAIQIKNLELINKKQQIQIKNLELINKKQQIQIKNLELINKKQQIQIKELLKKSKLHESLLLKDRFADLEFKRQQFETKFSEVRKEHKEDTKNYYNKLFSRPQIKNKFKKVRQLSRKDNRSKCPVHKENNNNTTKLKNQIDSKTECCSTSEFLDSSPFEFSNEEKKDYQNKGISSSRKKKSLFSKLFL
uniref:Uncharacterized protein n=1 Tax=Meloidogyne javanica TaxID=6303 RepID=A0A915M9K3_MELJA